MTDREWHFDDPDPIARLHQFGEFAHWWFTEHPGERELADLDVDVELDGFEIPAVLRSFYEMVKQWPIQRKKHHFGWNQNFVAYPAQLADSQLWKEHGLIQFAFENQGVTWWACPLDGDDPAVYDQVYESNVGDEPHSFPAGRCSTSLADFLIGFCLWEFVINGSAHTDLFQLTNALESGDEQWTVVTSAFGGEMTVGLYANKVLGARLPQWKKRDTWFLAGRSEEETKSALAPFVGGIRRMHIALPSSADPNELTWSLTICDDPTVFGQKPASKIVSLLERQVYSTDHFEITGPLRPIYDQLANNIASEPGDNLANLQVTQMGAKLLEGGQQLPGGHLPLADVVPVLQQCLDAILEPSDELTEMVGLGLGLQLTELTLDRREPPDAITGTRWAWPGQSLQAVTFDHRGVARFDMDDLRRRAGFGRTSNQPIGRWVLEGDQLTFDCADFTFYEMTIQGTTMSGMLRQPNRDHTAPLTLSLVDDAEMERREASRKLKLPLVSRTPWPADPDAATVAMQGTSWKLGEKTTVVFQPEGVVDFIYDDGRSATGGWILRDNDLIFDCNNFTQYNVTISGDIMTGTWVRVNDITRTARAKLTREPST